MATVFMILMFALFLADIVGLGYLAIKRLNNDKIKTVLYVVLLAIICVITFLISKYIVRGSIYGEGIPIDTSVRLK